MSKKDEQNEVNVTDGRRGTNRSTVGEFMTSSPLKCDVGLRLKDAEQRMYQNGARHLVVVSGHRVLGLLGLKRIGYMGALGGVELDDLLVGDAVDAHVPVIGPETLLIEATEMLESARGDALLVVDRHQRLLGVFSVEDALWALRTTLAADGEQPERARPREQVEQATPMVDRGVGEHARVRSLASRAMPSAASRTVLVDSIL